MFAKKDDLARVADSAASLASVNSSMNADNRVSRSATRSSRLL